MRSTVLFAALILSARALAQSDAQHPPPDWMVRGFEAAVADPASIQGAIESDAFSGLAGFVPSGRAGAMIDKLLPLLGDPNINARGAAVNALRQIATSERASAVIDKLLPLLGNPNTNAGVAAANVLGQIATGERADAVIDKLLPLLGDQNSNARSAAANALGQIATGERAGTVIDKLLPLLGDRDIYVRATRRTPSVSLRPASARAPSSTSCCRSLATRTTACRSRRRKSSAE